MDCTKLSDILNIFSYHKICIGIDKIHLLENSLLILHQENNFVRTFYWGTLNGVRNDYHVAYGYKKNVLNRRKYFYSLDGRQWVALPEANRCAIFFAPLMVNFFEGDPSIVTDVYNANPPLSPKDDISRYFNGPMSRKLREEDRLAAIVNLISKDAMVVPRAGWVKCPSIEIVENMAFEGLTVAEALQEKSYLHARLPEQESKTNLLTRLDYNYAIDFLDTINKDVPQTGCWHLQLNQSGDCTILDSLIWPGMTFYHKVDTPHYGALYVGQGKRNIDLPFIINL